MIVVSSGSEATRGSHPSLQCPRYTSKRPSDGWSGGVALLPVTTLAQRQSIPDCIADRLIVQD